MGDKPRILIVAEVLLVSAALLAVSWFVISSAFAYEKCGPSDKSTLSTFITIAVGFGLYIFSVSLAAIAIIEASNLRLYLHNIVLRGVVALLLGSTFAFMTYHVAEVLVWSYAEESEIDDCGPSSG